MNTGSTPANKTVGPLSLVFRDPLATFAFLFLVFIGFLAIFGPMLIGDLATTPNFRARNQPPFDVSMGPAYLLGADTLGRSLVARLVVGARYTMGIAVAAVICSLLLGATLGLVAGYSRGALSTLILRMADVIMSFPSLLLALIVLYSLGPSIPTLILVLAITRIPIYLRTMRAEVMEVRERMFVGAATALGASHARIVFRHIAPAVIPTMLTIAAIDFATVVLAESSLSFLGLGIQSPQFTWGSMVATGRGYLATAWWGAFWPGLLILLTTLSLNILSNWWRIYSDPHQRWRLELSRRLRRRIGR